MRHFKRSHFVGNARNIAFWVVLFLLILALFQMFNGTTSTSAARSVPYSEFVQRVEAGDVQSVTLDGERVLAKSKDGTSFGTIAPTDAALTDRLIAQGVEVRAESQEQSGIMSLIGVYLPFIILIGVWVFFMNRM